MLSTTRSGMFSTMRKSGRAGTWKKFQLMWEFKAIFQYNVGILYQTY